MSNQLQNQHPIAHFRKCVPKRPYATTNPKEGIWPHPKWLALEQPYIQANGCMMWCLIFDCDHEFAGCAAEDAILPPPNLMVLNWNNGRGHLIYFLRNPIPRTDFARIRPVQYAAKIERGMAKRLGADRSFAGLITKNPLHSSWRTIVLHNHRYQLSELDSFLHEDNCRSPPRQEVSGLGRNCMLFDELKAAAYRQVREFKRNGLSKSKFESWALQQAGTINGQFASPLMHSETRSIARSVVKWVWKNFDDTSFRKTQSERGRRGNAKRWKGHESIEKKRPWVELGISRATYYRLQKLNRLQERNGPRSS